MPFSFDEEVFSSFAFYATLSVVKMGALTVLTGVHRVKNGTFSNSEDVSYFVSKKKETKPVFTDVDVERARRNHLNDLENIPAFILVGLFYVLLTQPNPVTALWHFRVFAGARILHTLSYQLAWPQPSRAIFHNVGFACMVSMAVQVLMKTRY